MKFTTSVSVSLVLVSTLVAAAPAPAPRFGGGFGSRGRPTFSPPNRNNGGNNRGNNNNGGNNGGNNNNNGNNGNQGGTSGAAFFMTNEADGNFVVASSIGQNGKLTFSRAVSAGGRGLHGNVAANGPDGLFSQGSVQVGGDNLFVVNPGSDTVSMFSINPRDPTNIVMVGNPVSSGGEFPVSVAFEAAKNQACVLNGGQVNGVACFKPDAKLGLIQVPNTVRSLGLNQTTPATGPAGTVSHVVFSGDGSKLIASVKGIPPNAGFLAVWDVEEDGSLSANFNAITPPKGGLLPFGMAKLPANNNVIFATDAGIGFDVIDLQQALGAEAKAPTGITSLAATNVVAAGQSSANTVGGQVAVCWAAFSPKTGNFFVTDIGTSTVTEVNVDATSLKPTIVKQYPQASGSATIDDAVASIRGNDFLYVLAANATSVDVLSLTAPGQAKTIQTLNFAQNMRTARVTINPNNLQGMAVFVSN